jgi:two-component system, LytTR family, sensor kinase
MNPHFLFNSLNTLSSLINEDAEQAEDFLDHMSKVYRYLLRNNEEQLVTLGTELGFIRSYYFLLKARHADGLHLEVDVEPELQQLMIPPLTLQMIMEHSLNNNAASRTAPLALSISASDGWLLVRHNVQPKINRDDNNEVIENIRNKFRLLCQQEVEVTEQGGERKIRLPLIPHPQMVRV